MSLDLKRSFITVTEIVTYSKSKTSPHFSRPQITNIDKSKYCRWLLFFHNCNIAVTYIIIVSMVLFKKLGQSKNRSVGCVINTKTNFDKN